MTESLYSWRAQLVLGFHGCSKDVQESLVNTPASDMRISENSYDWLGPGMYFWENDSDRALEWAKAKYPKASAIVGAYIDLGLCLDFMSSAFLDLLTPAYESIATPELPENSESMLLTARLYDNSGLFLL